MTAVFQPPPTHAEVVIQGGADRWVFNPVWSKWLIELTQLINNSGGGGGTITHNSLAGLQGGGTGEYYHLTAAEHTYLTVASDTTKFLRGDKTWSDTLTGPFQATGITATGNLIVQGNTTLGDASGDTLTVAPNAVTWSNNPTHSGNHTFSGNVSIAGNSTFGDTTGDTITFTGRMATDILFATDDLRSIGTLSANRPRNLFLSRDLNCRNVGASGDVSLGSGGSQTVAINGYITTTLNWSADNTVDIGQLGAQRPRDLFLGRNLLADGNLTIKGNTALGDASGDTLTVAPNAVTWSNNPTHSGNHTFSGNVSIGGNTTLGDASGDSITFNADAWTLSNNTTITRTSGTAAAGVVMPYKEIYTFTGDSGGTTNYTAHNADITTSGANTITAIQSYASTVTHAGAATIISINTIKAGTVTLSSTGNVTNIRLFDASIPTFSSSGVITTFRQYASRNCGNATAITTGIVFEAVEQTGCVTLTAGFRGQLTSGTGKWNAYMDGTASNAFNGSVRIGSTVAPTVPLDVTGDINGSTNFTGWSSWTPTRTGWVDVGSPTVTARYCQIRNVVYIQIKIVPSTTTATTAGTSYINLPVACGASSIGGDGTLQNDTTFIAIGNCVFDIANSRCYLPTQGATANTLAIAAWYEV